MEEAEEVEEAEVVEVVEATMIMIRIREIIMVKINFTEEVEVKEILTAKEEKTMNGMVEEDKMNGMMEEDRMNGMV